MSIYCLLCPISNVCYSERYLIILWGSGLHLGAYKNRHRRFSFSHAICYVREKVVIALDPISQFKLKRALNDGTYENRKTEQIPPMA
jgi:hypothetical protein